ncbi:MAG: ABC transporter permease, partial [Peptococcaceae bacterium]|nr:ABC transporter permease [Peptococcaceae bacterium]
PFVVISGAILLLIFAGALLAPLSPYDPEMMDLAAKSRQPSWAHLFGTDEFGRDYFTRALYGGRVSLAVGVMSMLPALLLGSVYGAVSGYRGGWLDALMMRIVDILFSLPGFLLIIIFRTMAPAGLWPLVLIIGFFSWMPVARIARAETMSIKGRDFILAAKGLGGGGPRIMFNHIIPNASASILVAASLSVANAILMESALSFFGFGIKPPLASWGNMLQSAQGLILYQPYLAVFPGLLILLTVMSFNILGDAAREALSG